jgi:hypothetical protein
MRVQLASGLMSAVMAEVWSPWTTFTLGGLKGGTSKLGVVKFLLHFSFT